jgi:hypothetical protein
MKLDEKTLGIRVIQKILKKEEKEFEKGLEGKWGGGGENEKGHLMEERGG